MEIDHIRKMLAGRTVEISKFGVKSLAVFGSVARGEAHKGSDTDFLVEFEKPGFDVYMDLKFFLEELLDSPVDLVTEAALRPELRTAIKQEARLVA